MKNLRTVVVDDNPFDLLSIQDALLLNGHYSNENTYLNGSDFLNALQEKNLEFDLLIIDYRMPILSGIDTLRILSTQSINFKVLMVSHGFYQHVFNDLSQLGFRNYCRKKPDTIIESIPRVMAGVNIYQDLESLKNWERLSEKNALRLKDESHWRSELTPTEIKLIRLMCKGFSSKEIAAKMGYEPSSIEKYRGLLVRALDLRSSGQLVSWAFTQGIVTPSSIFMEAPEDYLGIYKRKES